MMLTVFYKLKRECLAINGVRRREHDDGLACLTDLFTWNCPPDYIRSENESEFSTISVMVERECANNQQGDGKYLPVYLQRSE
jgi:hypothetical protein